MFTQSSIGTASKWLVLAGTLLPLALAGCNTGKRTTSTTPTQRVAGERQEDETLGLVRKAGLPERFSYGGRAWQAHQIHWVEVSDSAATTTGNRIGNFTPVADLKVNGHQIHRQEGADEAVTDNIFLKADNLPPPATGDQATTGTGVTRVAFVEYDAEGETMADMELTQVLTATGMPQNITHGGKQWVAREVQVYDADVFDELKPGTQMINGHKAFMDEDEKDELYVMAEIKKPTGTTAAPSDSTTVTPGTTTGSSTTPSQPETIFIRYEPRK